MTPKHKKSLPNARQQGGAFGAAPKGAALRAAPFGVLVVFHLVRISYVLASFPEPVLARFSTKFADSENSLPQGASLKSLPEASQPTCRIRHGSTFQHILMVSMVVQYLLPLTGGIGYLIHLQEVILEIWVTASNEYTVYPFFKQTYCKCIFKVGRYTSSFITRLLIGAERLQPNRADTESFHRKSAPINY